MQRPQSNEYPSYFSAYINIVPEGDLLEILEEQRKALLELFASITEEQSEFRYAPEKWSMKEVLGHIMDTERIMAYRLLCVSRGDKTSLPGFDENEYVQGAAYDRRSLSSLTREFDALRTSTILLMEGTSQEAWTREGNANNNTVTARALAYIAAGHERHHARILKERYLPQLSGR
jgi:uncharacterized damage-inducible protein DinB